MLRYIKRNDHPTPFDRPPDMPPALHRLLVERGIGSAADAERFLHPDARSLREPMLLHDMGRAVEIIKNALAANLPICVYGDYDVDGVCASAIMLTWLRAQGAQAEVYLPSRHTEGYGLNEKAIREIAGWAKLLVTVDCGVTSVELVALAKALGLTVIVTDHHKPAETLPDCPVVNPLLGGYPFPGLCGAGVAWKLVWALSGEIPINLVDIAALATVADVVPLVDENRAIVALGLEQINRHPRTGIAALIEAAGLSKKPVTATTIAFQLAPRLNAGGRLDTALRPLHLIMSQNPIEARELAEALDAENTERRRVEQQILREAEAQLKDFDFIKHRAIILAGKGWNPGVIGLAASRLVEQYHYPVVMLSDQGDRLTGSCRSIEGVDIHAALTGCADTIVRFGGHRQAAGLTLEPSRLHDFIDAMDRWLFMNIPPAAYIPVQPYDTELSLESITPGLIAVLDRLQPTGFGNPAPVFRAEVEVLEARAVGMEGAHLKLTLAQDGHRLGGIAFREGRRAKALSNRSGSVDALFVPKLDEYMGRVTAQLEIRAIAENDAKARISSNIGDENALIGDFLTDILYNQKTPLFQRGALMEISLDDLSVRFAASPQGTAVIVGDLSAAARIAGMLPPAHMPDVYFGELPTDARAFNALCVCPPRGALPKGYAHVTLCGVPGAWLPEDGTAFRLSDVPGWTHELPDLDAMRAVYTAMVALSRRPLMFHGMNQLAHLVSAYSGEGQLTALAAIIAICAMGLFSVDADPPRIQRLSLKKADPDQCPVWRAIQRWRMGEMD